MPSKKAIELSLNFIVILIISIVIFGFGINFIARLSSQAAELQKMTASELDSKIGKIICEGSERVCISAYRKAIKKGGVGFFGLKITNVIEPPTGKSGEDFEIRIFPPVDSLGFKKDKSPIPLAEPNLIINPAARAVFIAQNEEREIGIGVQVPPDAVSGTYILNVEIKTADDGSPYSSIQKLYVDVS